MKLEDSHLLIGENMFRKERNNILFSMEMKGEGNKDDDEVSICMFFCENQEKYLLKIDSETIKNNEELNKYFVSPAEFYQEIVENFDSVILQNEGVLKVEIALGKTRKIVISLKGVKQERSTYEEKSKLPESIIEELTNLKKVNMNQSKQLQKLTCEMKATREQVEKQKQEIIKLWECLKLAQKKVEMKEEEVKKQKLSETKSVVAIIPHEEHILNSCFEINQTTNSIKKTSADLNWQNFVFEETVKVGERKQIKIYLQNTSKGQFQVGVLQKELFDKRNTFNFSDKQYTFKMGQNLFCTAAENYNIQTDFQPEQGRLVTFTMDMQIGNVSIAYQTFFFSELIQIYEFDLPFNIRDDQFYFFISICKPGESIIVCQ